MLFMHLWFIGTRANVFDACSPLWEQVGGGLALEISSFLGPRTSLWNGTRLSARCHFIGPKNTPFPGPNTLPLALVMDHHASKTLCTGPYKSQVHKQLFLTRKLFPVYFWKHINTGYGKNPSVLTYLIQCRHSLFMLMLWLSQLCCSYHAWC